LEYGSIKIKIGQNGLIFSPEQRLAVVEMLGAFKVANDFVREFNDNPEFNLLQACVYFEKGIYKIKFEDKKSFAEKSDWGYGAYPPSLSKTPCNHNKPKLKLHDLTNKLNHESISQPKRSEASLAKQIF